MDAPHPPVLATGGLRFGFEALLLECWKLEGFSVMRFRIHGFGLAGSFLSMQIGHHLLQTSQKWEHDLYRHDETSNPVRCFFAVRTVMFFRVSRYC